MSVPQLSPESSARFERLVRELSLALGPDSGLTTAGTNIDRMTQLMAEYESEEHEWQRYAFADASRNYTRNLVDAGNGKCNLLLLVWSPGKGSPIHDHADSHCLMKVLKGSLVETLYEWPVQDSKYVIERSSLAVRKKTTFSQDAVTYISDDIGLHQVVNPHAEEFAVSLHMYTPPNAAKFGCHIFDEATSRKQHVSQCHFYSEYGVRS